MSKIRIAIAAASAAAVAFGVYGLLWLPEPGTHSSTTIGSTLSNR